MRACVSKGAHAIFPRHYKNINVGCILMLEAPMSYANTRIAYRQFIERFGPDEFFSMKEWIDRNIESMGIQQILSFGDWAGMTPSSSFRARSASRICWMPMTKKCWIFEQASIKCGHRTM